MEEDIREQVVNALLQLRNAKLVQGGKELNCACPICGDSHSDRRGAHFYIKMPQTNTDPYVFHCFRIECLASGVLTEVELIEWGCMDSATSIKLSKYNSRVLSLEKNKKYKNSQVYILNNTFITPNKLSEVKLNYINKRLGIKLSYNDLLSKKIVLNLNDLLSMNNLPIRQDQIGCDLNESFLGFITQDNAFINARNLRPGKVDKSIDTKYYNINIFQIYGTISSMKFYTIPVNIDICNPARIKVHISEGPFDILSIYYNLKREHEHNIYSATLGGGYLAICKHFICNMNLINLEFHIYPDNDVDIRILYNVAKYLKIYSIPMYIHRNVCENEKDFGVPKNRIIEHIEKVLD